MGKGKIAAQASHASVCAYEKAKQKDPKIASEWFNFGQKKIVLKVSSEKEIIDFFMLMKREGIPSELIRDAGHTQIDSGTITALGVGPYDEGKLEQIFSKLKLL